MHLSLALLVPALALASPVEQLEARAASQYPTLVKNLNTVNTTLYQLNATVNTFHANQPLGAVTSLQIQQETNAITSALQSAINATVHSPVFNSKQTGVIATLTLSLINPINDTLNNLIRHRAAFRSGLLIVGSESKTVESVLIQQQNLTGVLGNDLGPKLAAPFNDYAPIITQELVDLFNPAIKAFKVCGGILCVPPIPL